jgi:hypothetical protein
LLATPDGASVAASTAKRTHGGGVLFVGTAAASRPIGGTSSRSSGTRTGTRIIYTHCCIRSSR